METSQQMSLDFQCTLVLLFAHQRSPPSETLSTIRFDALHTISTPYELTSGLYLHLGRNNQDITLGDMLGASKRGFEGGRSKSYIDERVRRQNEDQQLGRSGDMVVHETSPCCLIHLCVDFAIGLLQQEAFEDVEPDDKVVDEDDTDDQGTEGCQPRNRL